MVIEIRVDPQLDGLRADSFLSAKIGRLSRNRARVITSRGDLRRGDQPLKPASRVHAGELLQLHRVPPPEPAAPSAFRTLYDDGALVAIDKPAGLAIHPSARYFRTTLTQLLRAQALASGGGRPPVPCHRLDRETSGVLLLARDRDTEREVKRAFFDHKARKTYLALVEGKVETPAFCVDAPLAPGGSLIRMKMMPAREAPPAITHVRLVAHLGQRSLLACRPVTGRTHQIRAHLAVAGHPIVGDKIYGIQGEGWFLRRAAGGEAAAPLSELAWPRHCLHAVALVLDAPRPRCQSFFAAWPDDLPLVPLAPGWDRDVSSSWNSAAASSR